jgi:general secretion pathway protein F
MASFRYRAATASGEMRSGVLEGASQSEVLERLRRLGLLPIEATETAAPASTAPALKANAQTRRALVNALGELGVLLNAGLPLDRALAVSIENIQKPAMKAAFAKLRERVKQGVPLSRAMAEAPDLFPAIAAAMAEAGEASGKLDETLGRLAQTLDRTEALRQTIASALVYPALLLTVASAIILMMLLVVVPQFEDLFSDATTTLPFATRMVMGASEGLRNYGWAMLLGLIASVVAVRQWLKQPGVRATFDRTVLRVPALGPFVVTMETARFARVLGNLIDGGVGLPAALAISQRSIGNAHLAAAVGRVGQGLRHGGGLSGPLAATALFPPMALSFLRTGEETAQLGLMLNRLADVLDRDVRAAVERMIAVLTPAITIFMGAVVATVIASIMLAILGFNDLAIGP